MSKSPSANGIYTAYLTGVAGSSFGMFVLKDGVIAGGDAAGGIYDGSYSLSSDGKYWEGSIAFGMPVGGLTITGHSAQSEPLQIDVPLKLPLDFTEKSEIRIETPIGPLNARFVLVRTL